MNELYTQTELIRGRWYCYDPDRDIWYPIQAQESTASKYAWIVVVIALALVCYYVEYIR